MRVSELPRAVRHRWALFSGIMVVVIATALLTTSLLPDHYESTATYVVQPRAAEDDAVVRAASTLSDSAEINSTFARISESEVILSRARVRVGLGDESIPGLSVDTSVVSRTNVLEVSVRSRDPELSRDLADAIGAETVIYIDEVSEVFGLSPLDAPELPVESTGTSLTVTFLLAAIGGALLGAVVVAGVEVVTTREGRFEGRRILDSETSIYNEEYTQLRLHEEMARTDHDGEAFGVATIRVIYPWRDRRKGQDRVAMPNRGDLDRIAATLYPTLHSHDHLGHQRNVASGTFIALLPEQTVKEVEDLTERWRASVIQRMRRTYGRGVIVHSAVCAYEAGRFHGDPDAVQVVDDMLTSPVA